MFLNMGQSRHNLCLFSSFSHHISNTIELEPGAGIRTWGRRMVSCLLVQLILVKPDVKAFCHLPSIKTVKNRRQRVFENLFVREWYKTWTASTLVSTILLSDVKRYLNVKLILTQSHLKNVQSKKCSSKKCPSKKRRGLTGLCYSCLVRDHICVTISIAWL